jgi:hypothetical protein
VPREHDAFLAVQTLAGYGLPLSSETDLLFRPNEPIDADTSRSWRDAVGGEATPTFDGTRAEAARLLAGM